MKRILLYTLIFLLIPIVTYGSQIFSVPKLQIVDDEGDPAASWTLNFYYAGTSTPLTVYSDSSLSTSLGTSVTLDSRGEYGAIYLGASAKVILKNSAGTTKWTVDNWAGGSINPLDRVCLSSYTNLATAVAAISTTEVVLFLDKPDTLGGDLTIPATTTVVPVQGNLVTVGAHTLTIAGPVVGEADRIADVSGGGALTFSTESIIEYDSWDDGTPGFISINIAATKKLLLDVAANAADTYIIANAHKDSDGDTLVQVEESADEDIVRIDVGGDEKMYIGADATVSYIQVGAVKDEDADTMIQVEEAADEDIVRIDVAADEKMYIGADATASYIQVNAVKDEDADTMIQVEESADEDKVRVDTGGTQRVLIDSTGLTLTGVLIYTQTPQTLTGAGAVNVTTAITWLVTNAANALTLADGAEGQRKFIVMKTDGGAGTLTPTSLGNGSTITFDDVGDCADLLFTNGSWHMIGGTATLA